MEQNFYCNGIWFDTLDKAVAYSENHLEMEGVYRVVFTKAEIDSITKAIDKTIDHELECGK